MNEDQHSLEIWLGKCTDGMDLLKDVTENKRYLPTGIQGIDTLLGGGLRQGQLTEITGQSSSGKTQVCLCSASHVAARNMGVVLYLDTSNSFSPGRIARIVDELPISLVEEPKDVKLKRVMSSIICGKNPQGRSMMISVAMTLKKLADEHNLSVLVTNHMVAGNGAPKPALGESWKAVPHVRLMISCDRGNNIGTATVLKHTKLASGRHMKFAVPN